MKLSERIRPDVEAAPWVIDEIKRLESELADAYLEMAKIQRSVKAIFDRDVWDRVQSTLNDAADLNKTQYLSAVEREKLQAVLNARLRHMMDAIP